MSLEREAWLAERRLGIGGSDAAAVLNEGYGCARRLYYDKTAAKPDYQRSEASDLICRRGTVLEELVADEWAEQTGRKMRRMPSRASKSLPFLRVNVDRQILNDERGPGILECKTAAPFVFFDMQENGMPTQYVCQVQHAFIVTGYQWGEFAVREPSSWAPLNVPIAPNAAFAEMYIPKAQEFWQMVQEREIPEPLPFGDDRCSSCEYRRSCMGPRAEKEYLEAKDNEREDEESDEVIAPIVIAYREAQAQEEQATAKKDAIGDLLKAQMGDRTKVRVDAAGVKVHYKSQIASRWDSKALESDHPELIAKYKRPGAPTRPLKLLKIVDIPESKQKRKVKAL